MNASDTSSRNDTIDASTTTSVALLSTGELLRQPNHFIKGEAWLELLFIDIKGVKQMKTDVAPQQITVPQQYHS